MNISAKIQLHSLSFLGDEFLLFFREFSLSVAMTTNQIQQFGKNHMFGRGRLKEHF